MRLRSRLDRVLAAAPLKRLWHGRIGSVRLTVSSDRWLLRIGLSGSGQPASVVLVLSRSAPHLRWVTVLYGPDHPGCQAA